MAEPLRSHVFLTTPPPTTAAQGQGRPLPAARLLLRDSAMTTQTSGELGVRRKPQREYPQPMKAAMLVHFCDSWEMTEAPSHPYHISVHTNTQRKITHLPNEP